MYKKKEKTVNHSRVFFILNILFLIALFLYSLIPRAFSSSADRSIFAQHFNEKIKFQARVCQEPEFSYKNQKITLCTDKEKILVYASLYPRYEFNQILEIEGKINAPENFSDFNYSKYLEVRKIYSIIYYPKISFVKFADDDKSLELKFKKLLISIRQKGQEIINKSLAEPEASLASAMLFGYRRSLDQDDLEIFSEVGISHLLAISGAHIGILAAILLMLFSFFSLGRKASFIFISIFLFSYPLATGLTSSAIRASLMGFLAFLATALGRQKKAFRILVISANIMLVFNPLLLGFDLAFQLSFSAVLGIIFFEKKLSKISDKLIDSSYKSVFFKNIFKFIFSLLNLSLAAQIFSWPIIMLSFKKIPLISVFTNVFLSWTLPFILAFLLLGIFLSIIFPNLSLIFFWPSYILIKFIFFVSKLLSSLNFPMINFQEINYLYIFIYYIFLIFLINKAKRKKACIDG